MASFNAKALEVDEVELEMPNYMVNLMTDLVEGPLPEAKDKEAIVFKIARKGKAKGKPYQPYTSFQPRGQAEGPGTKRNTKEGNAKGWS